MGAPLGAGVGPGLGPGLGAGDGGGVGGTMRMRDPSRSRDVPSVTTSWPAARPLVMTTTLATVLVPTIAPGLPSSLLTRRPDLAEARAVLIAANADVRGAIAAFFPTIALTGSAGWQSAALNALFIPGSFLLSAAGSLSQPLFDGGTLLANLRVSRAIWREDVALYQSAVVQAFSDVETALTALHYATRQERLQARAVARARQALTAAEAQLRAGVVDIGTVLNAEQTLSSDETTLISARLTRLDAAVGLYKALGGGWTRPISKET